MVAFPCDILRAEVQTIFQQEPTDTDFHQVKRSPTREHRTTTCKQRDLAGWLYSSLVERSQKVHWSQNHTIKNEWIIGFIVMVIYLRNNSTNYHQRHKISLFNLHDIFTLKGHSSTISRPNSSKNEPPVVWFFLFSILHLFVATS